MMRDLFVYGTLRRETGSQMHDYLAANSTHLGEALFQGQLYRIEHFPGVVPSSDPSHQVVGDVFRLNDPTEMLDRLDAYEQIGNGFSEPYEFERCEAVVALRNGTRLPVWIYLYRWDVEGTEQILSGDFFSD
ncbi:gamma-glutamylcyclotransferase family protein [uncultured Cohaesibacter sp.]|uniref:gamma-glutamylcyclotransferase family protein n=1 Tax=uncultured Cohaesibacter sp. TaxID=1002546 RepID=UPI0029C84F47|nr:gamma-glutamylcyclotransferase family protein [uncultured Cohaesibacter sp.]